MHIAIIGPGATGGLLAATLLKAGARVSLLCRDAGRAARLRRTGLTVSGATQAQASGADFAAITHDPRRIAGAEAVFLCVKSYDAAGAIREAKVLASEGAPVVSLLNGLAHVPLLQKAIPAAQAVYGVGFFSSYRTGPGQVTHAGGRGIELASGEAPRALIDLLRSAGWAVKYAGEDVDGLLWRKLVLNAAINPLAALSGKPNGALIEEPALEELLARAASEGEAVMRAKGIEGSTGLAATAAALCRDTKDNVNSMLSDLRGGRRTERDAILLPILDAGRKHKVPTPVLSSVYDWVGALEKTRG